MSTVEADLLRRIRDGDRRALRTLVDEIGPAALALARRVTNNPDLAEEAVQEAFLEVWRRSARFDSRRGNARTWVLAVVHHKAVDAVRRERAATRWDEEVPLPAEADDPEGRSVMSDRRDRVLKAIAELSPVQREAIMLAYFGGLTYRQVAEHLEIPEGTAKSRLRDGLLTLRGALETFGIEMGKP